MKVLSSPQQFHVKMDGFAYAFLTVGWRAEGDWRILRELCAKENQGLGSD